MQDSNGNQLAIQYKVGQGSVAVNTSARLDWIQDARLDTGQNASYRFTYDDSGHCGRKRRGCLK